jgi:hypothetical protein
LASLTFGRDFNKPVNKLPETLESLSFGTYFNQNINVKNLTCLKTLILADEYSYPIELTDCALTLKNIKHGERLIDLTVLKKWLQ